MTIRANLESVRVRIAAAAARAGRSPGEVALIAVTKQRSVEEIREVIAAGQRALGENRVQEALAKLDAFAAETYDPPLDWHFIGHLQTNKVRKVVGKFSLFHGVDSLRLAEVLQKEADAANCDVEILLEINVSGEASKYGMAPEEAERVLRGMGHLDRLRCLGLMTMAPFEAEPEATRPVFRALRELRDRLREQGYEGADLRHLSMGMTNDFEVAVEEGATLVRIGTALFAA